MRSGLGFFGVLGEGVGGLQLTHRTLLGARVFFSTLSRFLSGWGFLREEFSFHRDFFCPTFLSVFLFSRIFLPFPIHLISFYFLPPFLSFLLPIFLDFLSENLLTTVTSPIFSPISSLFPVFLFSVILFLIFLLFFSLFLSQFFLPFRFFPFQSFLHLFLSFLLFCLFLSAFLLGFLFLLDFLVF